MRLELQRPGTPRGKRLGVALVVANLLGAALATLWPLRFRLDGASLARKWRHVEWVLVYRDRRGHLLVDRDLLLNLALLLPLGLGLALARRATGAARVLVEALLLGAVTAASLEAAQLLTPHRVTQLADVWRNALGCVLGAALGLALRPSSPPSPPGSPPGSSPPAPPPE
jgi:VanZ family protein